MHLRRIPRLALLALAGLLAACSASPPRPGAAFERHALAQREREISGSAERRRDPEREANIRALLCRIHADGCEGIRLYLLDRPAPVADLSADGVLRLNLGLLALIEAESELAFVLAHESAHRVLDHFARRRAPDWNLTRAEAEADAWAMHRLGELGLRRCAGAQLLRRIAVARELTESERAQLNERLRAMDCA